MFSAMATRVASVKTTNAGTLSVLEMSFRQATNLSNVAGSYVGGHSWQRPIFRSPPVVSTAPHVRHLATFAREERLALDSDAVPALVVVVRIPCKNRDGLRLARPPAGVEHAQEEYDGAVARV